MSSEQGWTSGPDSRGSFDILWTCLSTLALCVWTAVHPNIQLHASTKRNLLAQLGMISVAVVLPELLISSAWRQRLEARRLVKSVSSLTLGSHISRLESDAHTQTSTLPSPVKALTPELVEPSPLKHAQNPETVETTKKWNEKQAFFAVMGGFAAESAYRDSSDRLVVQKHILTCEGVMLLAKAGCLPKVSLEDIEERSRADLIAKLIVVCQVGWFAIQVIARLATKLPVTPLEAHTVVHVGCALVMYIMWWQKPYNVDRSSILSDAMTKKVVALLVFRNALQEVFREARACYEADRERYWRNRVLELSNDILDHDPPPVPPVLPPIDKALDDCMAGIRQTHASDGIDRLMNQLAYDAKDAIKALSLQEPEDSVVKLLNRTDWIGIRQTPHNFRLRAVWGSWTGNSGHEFSSEKMIHIIFNLVYGSGHIAVWNSIFPTSIERWFWRGSAIMLTAVPLWGAVWILWWKAVGSRRKWLWMFRNGDLEIVAGPAFCAIIILYSITRCYFLVESLLCLRLLPVGAYQQVSWNNFLPHVG